MGTTPNPLVFTNNGTGTPNGTGVTATEYGNQNTLHRTELKLDGLALTLTDEAGVVGYVGQKIYDFPEGAIMILGAVADLTVTESGATAATASGDFSLGTATASNNATLTSTEADVIPSTAFGPLVSSAGTLKGISLAVITSLTNSTGRTPDDTLANHADLSTYATDAAVIEQNVADLGGKINEIIALISGLFAKVLDGTATAKDLYLNVLVDDADQAGGTLTITGTISITWINLGDK